MPITGHAVNAAATLYDVPAKELWQCRVLSAEGVELGRAVGQIIEPAAYSVRYIIILDPQARRCLLPATLVEDAGAGCIISAVSSVDTSLPSYSEPLERCAEEAAHDCLQCRPYWC